MATTNFQTGTLIESTWLNDVDNAVYVDVPQIAVNTAAIAVNTGAIAAHIADTIEAHASTAIGYVPSGTGAIATTVQEKLRQTVSVLDFGADPTGVTDSTAAFNLATKATYTSTGNTDLNFPSLVEIPAGEYLITDTVFVHKGQTLRGAGEGATRIRCATATGLDAGVFKLGYSTTAIDAGGLPPEICGMFIEGPSIGTGIYCRVNGASIHNIFISYADTAIDLGGTDARVNNVQIDAGHTGISVGGHNHIISNVLFYLNDYAAISTHDDGAVGCADITVSDCQIYYPQARGILFNSGVTHRSLSFNNINFFLNTQYAGFSGFVINSSTSPTNISFNSCTFSNMKDYAVYIGGSGAQFSFNDCVFNGTKTVSAYTQSTTAYAAYLILGETFFNNCRFTDLLVNSPIKVVTAGGGQVKAFINGGNITNCAGSYVVDTTGSAAVVFGSLVSVKNMQFIQQDRLATNAAEANWSVETDIPMRITSGTSPYIVGRSTVFLDTSGGAVSITVPRTDWGDEVGAKQGDHLTYIDYSGTWGATNPGFLSGDNSIDATGPGGTWNPPATSKKISLVFNTVTNTWRTY